MKNNVYLAQVNNTYGNNVYLPYSVGLLQAYCQTIKEINDSFSFKDFIYLRDDPDTVTRRLDHPKIFGISCYIWNWEWSKALARSIKGYHPGCLVVLGGPQVPVRSADFFCQHPYVDLLVHYEGEVTFSEILLEYLIESPDYTRVKGISVRVDENRCYQTPNREKLTNLEELPSPYLAGTLDNLLTAPYSFQASQETHRGCPYSCTFCDWGSAVFTKVRPFSSERLEREFEWFGKNQIEFLYNCDANYGLLQRDHALTEKLVGTKRKYGFPEQFRAAYAKNSNTKIFGIAKLLNDAGMSKGVSLSFQSLDAHTLDIIKRSNIKVGDFAELMKLYRKEGIPTYTELIMALPGETYDSFASGIDKLVEAGMHEGLNIYLCSVLPNSEMGDPSYIEKHGIKFVKTPVLLQHSSPRTDAITEYTDIVVETNTMSREDYKKIFLFCWAVQCFHCLNLTQYLAIFMNSQFGVRYRTFYEELIEFAKTNPKTLLAAQLQLVSELVNKAVGGGSWDVIDPRFGNVLWPTEEATYLNLVVEKDMVCTEISDFLRHLLSVHGLQVEEELLSDLVKYQKHMIVDPFTPESFMIDLGYNLHEYFANGYQGIPTRLTKIPSRLKVIAETPFNGNLELYAQKVVWYGRKGGKFRHTNVTDVRTSARRV
jgi:radical SAM superfamily enzyme YgiQ (UPF0313 family)